jgi:hypothetical protein
VEEERERERIKHKFKNIKKLNMVGILSGNQQFDEKVNYDKVFINTIRTSNLKHFKLLLEFQKIDPSINYNLTLCEALMINDIAHSPKLKEISEKMIKLLLKDPRVTSEESIINFILTDTCSMNYVMKNCMSLQYVCSKILVEKCNINNIIDKCMSQINNMAYNARNNKYIHIEKLLYISYNNPKIDLDKFVIYILIFVILSIMY